MKKWALWLGAALLFGAWLWPLPRLGIPPFTRHMVMHMVVVAVASPALALGVAGSRLDPVSRAPGWFAAIPASGVELVGVWMWHAPTLHGAARLYPWASALEQATFLLSGLWLWLAAVGGSAELRRARAGQSVLALLLTSTHMTLLGALITLADRPLYAHGHGAATAHGTFDQHIGGAVMLLVGGVAYLLGGLGLLADVLRRSEVPEVLK